MLIIHNNIDQFKAMASGPHDFIGKDSICNLHDQKKTDKRTKC